MEKQLIVSYEGPEDLNGLREKYRRDIMKSLSLVSQAEEIVLIGAGGGKLVCWDFESLSDNIIETPPDDNAMMKPAFLDGSRSKLRKGAGHHKLKKRKKK